VVDTETDFPGAPEGASMFGNQLAWLQADLEAANLNRNEIPWLIVTGHRPIYTSSSAHYNTTTGQTCTCTKLLAQFTKYVDV